LRNGKLDRRSKVAVVEGAERRIPHRMVEK